MEKYSGKAELMSTNSENRGEEISHLWMWFVLGVCLFFLAASIKSGDTLYLIGSIVFFIACIFFIIPLAIKKNN